MAQNGSNQPTAESRRQAMLAFQRMRSESLHDSHTTTGDGNSGVIQSPKKSQTVDNRTWYQKVIDALGGRP